MLAATGTGPGRTAGEWHTHAPTADLPTLLHDCSVMLTACLHHHASSPRGLRVAPTAHESRQRLASRLVMHRPAPVLQDGCDRGWQAVSSV